MDFNRFVSAVGFSSEKTDFCPLSLVQFGIPPHLQVIAVSRYWILNGML
jgi:hypothetical protein